MRFQIEPDTTIYDVDSVDRMSLRDILQLARQTALEGLEITPGKLAEMTAALKSMSDAERKQRIEAIWIVAITIYIARRRSGEEISFVDSIDFPITSLRWLPDPKDHQQAADPTRARRASGRAKSGQRPAAKTTATSKQPSTAV